MDPEHLNLSALDPAGDPDRWESRIQVIMDRALPELVRRRAARSPLVLLAAWARPMLAAMAVLATISITTLLTARRVPDPIAVEATGIVEELRVPAPVSTWLTEERAPTVDDLILALDGDNR